MLKTSLSDELLEHLAGLAERPQEVASTTRRVPNHVLYGGAHLFRHDAAARLGARALDVLAAGCPSGPADLMGALGFSDPDGHLLAAVMRKLKSEPIENLRIDFEDGFGIRADDEEDREAVRVGHELARAMEEGTLPPLVGIRIKACATTTFRRALRTLDLTLTALVERSGGALPSPFIVALPKVTEPREVEALVEGLGHLERALFLPGGAASVELMVEDPRALFRDGRLALDSLIDAGDGRVVALHFGAYDYLSALGVPASAQTLAHPACDLARQLMRVAAQGRDLDVFDGATTTLPLAIHRGDGLSGPQRAENAAAIVDAWRLHVEDVRRSCAQGLFASWDLHPGQLVSRYAALAAFYLEEARRAAPRLKKFVEEETKASRVGTVFDDAATVRGLKLFFARGLDSGFLTVDDLRALGVEPEWVDAQTTFATPTT